MAIQQIQKSSVFKPDMIGDLVEITAYSQKDGSLTSLVGHLETYGVDSTGTTFVIAGNGKANFFPTTGYTISITHYEYILDLTSEDDQ